jgi:hypothetical protein
VGWQKFGGDHKPTKPSFGRHADNLAPLATNFWDRNGRVFLKTGAAIVPAFYVIHICSNAHICHSPRGVGYMRELGEKLLLSLNEVSGLTGVGRTNLYREIREKRLRARKQGAKTVVTKADLITWIDQLPDFRSNDPAGSNHP